MRIGLDLQATRGPVSGIGAYAQGLAEALEATAGGGPHTFVPLWFRGFARWPAPAEMARAQLGLAAAGWSRRLDLIHAPGFAPPLWGRARRLFTVHDLSVWQRPELLPPGPSRLYWRDWMAFAARHADGLVAPSHFTAEILRACLGVPAARIRHVPYPPRTLFRPAPPERQAELRRRFHLPRPYILGLGAAEPRKDWPGVVRAFAQMRQRDTHDLVLAGGDNVAASAVALEQEIARLIDRRGPQPGLRPGAPLRRALARGPREPRASARLAGVAPALPAGQTARPPRAANRPGCVRRLGFVPTAWLPALYSAAEVFVFPETYAGYGLPVLEAMACGTPVVTYANTALPEVAAGAALLLPPPYRPAALAEMLSALLEDERQREELRRRGRARVAELDWARTARAMVEIYEEFGPCAAASRRCLA